MSRAVSIGDVLLIDFPSLAPPGVEQMGLRPAVVAGLPERLGRQRYPTWIVVPMTSTVGSWTRQAPDLYPIFKAGTAKLKLDTVALIDQVRGVDHTRIVRQLGTLTAEQYEPIREGLERVLEWQN